MFVPRRSNNKLSKLFFGISLLLQVASIYRHYRASKDKNGRR